MSRRVLVRILFGSAVAMIVVDPLLGSDARAQPVNSDPRGKSAAGQSLGAAPQNLGDAGTTVPSAVATDTGSTVATPPTSDGGTPRETDKPQANPKSDVSATSSNTIPATGSEASTSAQTLPPSPDGNAETSSGAGLFEQSVGGTSSLAADAGTESVQRGFDLNGYVRGTTFVGKVPDSSAGMIKAAYGELALKFQVHKERFGDGYAEIRVRDGQQGPVRNLFVDLREAYVNGYLGPLDLRLGKQIIVWGRADAFNPTNNLTPADLRIRSPVEDDRRVGNVGARAFLNLTPVRVEGVWMPLYSASELPSFRLPDYVAFGDPKYPSPKLGNGLGAGRVHLELPAFDISVSYLHGYAPLPGLTLQSYTVGVNPTVILVSRTAYDQDVVGFDFSTTIRDILGVRGEAAYRRPVDYRNRIYAPRPDLQYVLGLDHAFGPVSVIAQYLGRYVFDWQRENGPINPIDPAVLAGFTPPLPALLTGQINDTIDGQLRQKNQVLFSQTARVQHLSSVRVEWLTQHETLSLSALCLVNFTTREWLAFPKIGYQLSDRMSAAVGAEIYMGPDGTLFGLIKEELSAGYAELRFTF